MGRGKTGGKRLVVREGGVVQNAAGRQGARGLKMQITLQKLTCALRSLSVIQAMAARVPDKRAITYVDQKVRGSQTPPCGLKLEVSAACTHCQPTAADCQFHP